MVADHDHQFRSYFGVSAKVCVDLWHRMSLSLGAKPKHLLWALLYLKTYGTETTLSSRCLVTRKTYRKWVRLMLPRIAELAPHLVCYQLFGYCFTELFEC